MVLLIKNEKTALNVIGRNSVPYHQRMTLPPGVMESNPLSRGKNRLGVRSAKTALTGIEQAAGKLKRYGTLDHKLHLACGASRCSIENDASYDPPYSI